MNKSPLETWHQLLKSRNAGGLDDLLAENAVFHSPVVHTPQIGKAITKKYLSAAMHVFGSPSFHYVRETVGEQNAVLEFELELDGVKINGVDLVEWNEQGKITNFKVMIRPLKAINMIHQKMASMLSAQG